MSVSFTPTLVARNPMTARLLVLVLTIGLVSGCAKAFFVLDLIGKGLTPRKTMARTPKARVELNVDIGVASANASGPTEQWAGPVAITMKNVSTGRRYRLHVVAGLGTGKLGAGVYDFQRIVAGALQLDVATRLPQIQVEPGDGPQHFGTLHLRVVKLPPGPLIDQAAAAARVVEERESTVVDFAYVPEGGFVLVEADLWAESP